MKIDGPLIKAEFIERPNRFITIVRIGNETVASHLPDPGRLKELLVPGATLLVHPAPAGSTRKTQYTTVMVYNKGTLISLVSALPNRFVREHLKRNRFSFLSGYRLVRPEVAYNGHRFDFLLEDKAGQFMYLEVKSVTFAENRTGKFPDAVTTRGTSHIRTLSQICKNGGKAGILFVCQRPDVDRFEPMWVVDPVFSAALKDASKTGVEIWCISTKVTESDMTFFREIPVYLEPS